MAIVVTTDISEASTVAFPYAIDAAVRSGGSVELLNIFEEPVVPMPFLDVPPPGDWMESIREEAKQSVTSKLDAITSGCFNGISVKKTLKVAEGSTADAIVRHATENKAELIIMACQGHGLVSRTLLGSVSERVLRRSRCPVLLIPVHHRNGGGLAARLPFRKIGVTTDLSPASEKAFPIASQWARQAGAEFELLYVLEALFAPELLQSKITGGEREPEAIQAQYKAAVEARVEKLAAAFGNPKPRGVVLDKTYSVGNSIADYAASAGLDLLITATRGGGAAFAFIGGVTERLSRQTPCPLLVVPQES